MPVDERNTLRSRLPPQLAGLAVGGAPPPPLAPSSVARYIVTAFASASLKPNAGILVSGFIACGFFTHR